MMKDDRQFLANLSALCGGYIDLIQHEDFYRDNKILDVELQKEFILKELSQALNVHEVNIKSVIDKFNIDQSISYQTLGIELAKQLYHKLDNRGK